MYDAKEARQLCIRAIKQYTKASDISTQEKADGRRTLGLLNEGGDPSKTPGRILCVALASYLKSLKSIENFMLSDPSFLGFDGSNLCWWHWTRRSALRWTPRVRYATMMFQSANPGLIGNRSSQASTYNLHKTALSSPRFLRFSWSYSRMFWSYFQRSLHRAWSLERVYSGDGCFPEHPPAPTIGAPTE